MMVKFSIPTGPANVNMDIPLPPWNKVRGWFQRRSDPALSVQLRLKHAEIRIERANEGSAVFFMEVLNFFRRPVTIDRVLLSYWSWSSYSLPDTEPIVNGIRSVVPRRGTDPLSMTIHLNEKAIRIIRDARVKASNVFSSPRVQLSMYGQLYLLESRTPVAYEFNVPCPEVWIYSEEPQVTAPPDPWADLAEHPLLQPGQAGSEYVAMTAQEVAAIADAVKKIREYFVAEGISLTADQWQFLTSRLDYLVSAAARQSGEDWKHTAIGVLVTIVTGLALAPEQARRIWHLLTNALQEAIELLEH